MWFSKKQVEKQESSKATGQVTTKASAPATTKAKGDAAEAFALAYLRQAGMALVATNYRTPGRGGGEIDLIMTGPDGTLVFIEVRQRANASHGGAGASISLHKQQRIVFAARHYLMRLKAPPPCRFDVLLITGGVGAADIPAVEWLRSAFDAG